jgi:hypothetical protein
MVGCTWYTRDWFVLAPAWVLRTGSRRNVIRLNSATTRLLWERLGLVTSESVQRAWNDDVEVAQRGLWCETLEATPEVRGSFGKAS